jgi:hypothetical protein
MKPHELASAAVRGKPKSPAHKEAIRRGLVAWQKRRKYRRALAPMHVQEWLDTRQVCPALVPIVTARADHAARMVEELGGPDAVTAMQRAALDQWLAAQVAADACVLQFWRDGSLTTRAADRMTAYLGAARNALALLGMERRERNALDVRAYLAAKSEARVEAAPDRASEGIVGVPLERDADAEADLLVPESGGTEHDEQVPQVAAPSSSDLVAEPSAGSGLDLPPAQVESAAEAVYRGWLDDGRPYVPLSRVRR